MKVRARVEDPALVERRRRQIVAASIALFGKRGYYATTIRDIAARAGVSVGLIYQYFGDKEDVLFLTIVDVLDTYRDRTPAATAGIGDPLERFRAAVHAYQRPARALRRGLHRGRPVRAHRRGHARLPDLLVDLGAVPGLSELRWNDAACDIGACCTLARLAGDARLRGEFPALAQAALSVAAPYYNQSEEWRRSNGYCLKRGGDACHVAPRGTRSVPLDALYRDDGATQFALHSGEFISRIRVPRTPANQRSAYRKVRARRAIDFPLAGVAVVLAMQSATLRKLRIALTQANYRRQVAAVTAQRLVKELAVA